MNIWAWVERAQEELRAAGRSRLAELMDLVPEYMSDNKHEQLDAIMPEAIALAREAKQPWIEVFLRHWHLQSCILQRYLIREYLPDAVSLIELANRDETRNCPQSVCTTQDLANCYAHADGPGYAKERLAVASETLARITPDWPCFTCISGEYATALIDSDDPQGALDLIHKQKSELVRIGRADRRDDMCGTEVDALILLGRLEEAYALNERAQDRLRGESFMEFRRLDRARILARLGRIEEAKKSLPPFDRVVRTQSQYEPWVDAVEHLALAGVLENGVRLFGELETLHRLMKKNGVIRRAIRIAHAQARLALVASRPQLAARSARAIEALIPELRLPLDAPAELEALRAKVAAAASQRVVPPLPETPEETIALLSGEVEVDFELLERATDNWPAHEELAIRLADALLALRDVEGAKQVFAAIGARAADGAPNALMRQLHMLSSHGERGELERTASARLANAENTEIAARSHWALAIHHSTHERWEPARAELLKILELKADAVNTTIMLAKIERKLGDTASAFARVDALIDSAPPGLIDWERMISGTLLARWKAVRDSAKRLGFELEGEGPVDHDGEICRVRFDDDKMRYAIRTGPVTARIVEVAFPSETQRYLDRVVLDVAPPDDDAGGEVRVHGCAGILSRGGFKSFAIDGFHPGDAALVRLREAAAKTGARLEVRSDENYQIEDPDSGEDRLGLFALLAVREDGELGAVYEALTAVAVDFERPLVWPALLEALGRDEEAEYQRDTAERYGLF